MAVYTRPSETALRAFLDAHGVAADARVEGIPAGSVNTNLAVIEPSGRRLFLRIYEEQGPEGARAEAAMLARLAAAGVPTPPPLAAPGELAGKPAVFFAWRDGTMRCQASVRPTDATKVGAALARIHTAGGEPTGRDGAGRFGPVELRARIDRIARDAAPSLAAEATGLAQKLALHHERAARHPDLPRGLVHGDLFRDNVLFADDGEISALLDFESAFHGVLLFDVMVTVLSWCVGDALDPSLARALVDGYRAVRPFEPVELEPEALHAQACVAALRFTVTRITDYAMRPAPGRVMKDWRRFADRLAQLERLGPAGLASMMLG